MSSKGGKFIRDLLATAFKSGEPIGTEDAKVPVMWAERLAGLTAPLNAFDATPKSYVDSLRTSFKSVLSIESSRPGSPTSGDRHLLVGLVDQSYTYILISAASGGELGANLNGNAFFFTGTASDFDSYTDAFVAHYAGSPGWSAIKYSSQIFGVKQGTTPVTGGFQGPINFTATPVDANEGNIATWGGAAWTYEAPVHGWTVLVEDEQEVYWYDASWAKVGDVSDFKSDGSIPMTGDLIVGTGPLPTIWIPNGVREVISNTGGESNLQLVANGEELVEASFGTWSGAGEKMAFVGADTNHSFVIYSNNKNNILIRDGETMVARQTTPGGTNRPLANAVLSVVMDSEAEGVDGFKVLDGTDEKFTVGADGWINLHRTSLKASDSFFIDGNGAVLINMGGTGSGVPGLTLQRWSTTNSNNPMMVFRSGDGSTVLSQFDKDANLEVPKVTTAEVLAAAAGQLDLYVLDGAGNSGISIYNNMVELFGPIKMNGAVDMSPYGTPHDITGVSNLHMAAGAYGTLAVDNTNGFQLQSENGLAGLYLDQNEVDIFAAVHAEIHAGDSVSIRSNGTGPNNYVEINCENDGLIYLGPNGAGDIRIGNLSGGATKIKSPTISMESQRVQNVANPTSAQDAATKSYVDGLSGANTALSNLIATAINQSLLPNGDYTKNLGSSTNNWNQVWADALYGSGAQGLPDDGSGNSGGFGVYSTTPLVDGHSGGIYMQSGNTAGPTAGRTVGYVNLSTGQTVDATHDPGEGINLRTGNNSYTASAQISLITGSAFSVSGSGDSGGITLQTGLAGIGGGNRGKIVLDGLEVDVSSKKITNLATPTAASDAATKSYVDSAGSGANTTLSNLGTTSINAALLPSADVTRNLGSTTLRWSALYASLMKDASDATVIDLTNRRLYQGGSIAMDWSGSHPDFNARKLTNVADPTSVTDVTTKQYVDSFFSGNQVQNGNFEAAGVGQWAKYNDSSGSAAAATLTLASGGTGVLLTAVGTGIAGNAISVSTLDDGGSPADVSTYTQANGDIHIQIETDGTGTNQDVVDAINAAASAYVTASTSSGGTAYVSPTPTHGSNFYLSGGHVAQPGASPLDATGGTDSTSTLGRVTGFGGAQAIGPISGSGSLEWSSNGTNFTQGKGVSVPFTLAAGHGFYGYRPIKISFLCAKSGSATIKPYVLDLDTGLITDLTARGGTYGVWGPQSGDYRQFVYEYIPRPFSQNFRLAFHNIAASAANQDTLLFDSIKIDQYEDFTISSVAGCGNNQSITNNTDTTANFTAIDDPVQILRSDAGYYVLIPSTGRYFVEFHVAFAANATGDRKGWVEKSNDGGSTYGPIGITDLVGAHPTGQTTVKAGRILSLYQNERLRIRLFQTSGGSLSTVNDVDQNFLSVYKIGSNK